MSLTVKRGMPDPWVSGLTIVQVNPELKAGKAKGPYGFRLRDVENIYTYIAIGSSNTVLLVVEFRTKCGLAGHDCRFVFGEYQGRNLLEIPYLLIEDEAGAQMLLSDTPWRDQLQLYKTLLPEKTPDDNPYYMG